MAVPVFLPITNYIYIGERYFNSLKVFLLGSLLSVLIYALAVAGLKLVINHIIALYPEVQHTKQRMLVMLIVVSILSIFIVTAATYIYGLFPLFGTKADLATIGAMVVVAITFDVIFCTVLGVSYLYKQWQNNQQEQEQLKKQSLQLQFNTLKDQVNPGFLFGSLESLTTLIGKNTPEAEKFVDELAKVYRYVLRANKEKLSSLEAELNFLDSYLYLLSNRYEHAILVEVNGLQGQQQKCLPSLSLQRLLDFTLQLAEISMERPLTISIQLKDAERLVYGAKFSPLPGLQPADSRDLSCLQKGYELFGNAPVVKLEHGGNLLAELPLLSQQASLTVHL
ncbi:histidine kinase [Cesiribacter sp. SM1]|uniref:histidine kinase n=1 Tax=Cesiribacter sp. SM1 TaxID=2861196 RepID=UPI001CD60FD3|nr:histidine kinase [Cesiribacter sp. SM1]